MKDMKPLIIETAVGMILMGMSFFIQADYYSTMVFSVGIGLGAASAAQMIRIAYWKNPKRREAYEAKKREAHINSVDERKQYLRMKAGHISCQIMACLLLAIAFILALVRAEAWVIAMMFLLFLFQGVIGISVYRMLQKKM